MIMIKTRDFWLFSVVFVFLIIGISSTLLYRIYGEETESFDPVSFSKTDFQAGAALLSESNIDREQNLARLKNKIASGQGEIDAGPPIFTSVDETPGPENVEGARVVMTCGDYIEYNPRLSSWPSQVTQELVEGARIIKDSEGKTLLQLQSNPIVLGQSHCLSSNVVGVSSYGSLISNQSASVSNYEPLQLIGYALDGFPIYGPRLDDTTLDECGGLLSPTGYQYHVRNNEDFVLACFAGVPINI